MSQAGNLPFKLQVDDALCHTCRRCLGAEVCRGNAFWLLDPEDGPFIDMSRCWGCLKCMVTCPFEAIVKIDYGSETAAR